MQLHFPLFFLILSMYKNNLFRFNLNHIDIPKEYPGMKLLLDQNYIYNILIVKRTF